ncbi:MAG: hypothetical protein V1651_01195 [Patescibacteria group bacterium]
MTMKTIQYNIIMLALFILVIVASLSVFLSNRTKDSPITQCLPAVKKAESKICQTQICKRLPAE